MIYQIKRDANGDVLPCQACGSEVATAEFSSDRKHQRLCVFCANRTGNRGDAVTNMELCQMMNVLWDEVLRATK